MGFIRKIIRFIRKNGIRGVVKRLDETEHKIDVFSYYNYITDETKIPLDTDEASRIGDENICLNWIIPEMGIGSGGHINIFRFISGLEENGMHNRVYIFNPINFHDNEVLMEFIREHFKILDTRVEVFCDVSHISYAHATIATSWQTAYFVKNFDNTQGKFYFIQDFEPYFYALGSEYEFAEKTYNFGFRGITAGDWLRDICRNQYGMTADSFGFSYDKEHYFPGTKRDDVKRVFFYARPVTPRRDFELGLLALKKLSESIENLEVVFAGWDISKYNIPFRYKNMGIVSLDKLSDLYAQCDMCLILSNTNLSLLPLEVMASNAVAVCSKGENSTWLVNEENSILVDYEPLEIAKTIEFYFNNPDKLDKIRQKGLKFAQNTNWENEVVKVKNAILEGLEENAK